MAAPRSGRHHGRVPATSRRPQRIVLAGGGVGALEAVLALRDLLGREVDVVLVCPEREFVYQPLAVAEPFDPEQGRRWDLARMAQDLGVELRHDALDGVDAESKEVLLRGGARLAYDVLVIATGSRRLEWLPGALSFGGPADVPAVRRLLEDLEAGDVAAVAFTAPPQSTWVLPLYELALLTAARIAERGIADVSLSLVTAESEPLALFGPAASRTMRSLLGDRGVRLLAQRYAVAYDGSALELVDGTVVPADRVIALPRLQGPGLDGLPADAGGFIPVDAHGAVTGLADVYAVGDAAAHPVKQGGLAVQQADAAAEAIAADLGAEVDPQPFRPVLRGLLLTGLAPTFLQAQLRGAGSQASPDALWWPPSKIAGGRLAGYLARLEAEAGGPGPAGPGRRDSAAARRDLRELALSFADMDAGAGELSSALQWLDVVEAIDGEASADLEGKRRRWRRDSGEAGERRPEDRLDGLVSSAG
jgi:sulfide:quinone oxidoreductase